MIYSKGVYDTGNHRRCVPGPDIVQHRLQAEVQLLPVQRVKVQLSRVPGAHRMMSTCVKNGETEPVVVVRLQVLERSATTYMRIYMYLIW